MGFDVVNVGRRQAGICQCGPNHGLLREPVTDKDGRCLSVFERISNAMRWLLQARDARGLSYIAQGDWCDPMNMVGYRGKGVSGWLSLATAYALTGSSLNIVPILLYAQIRGDVLHNPNLGYAMALGMIVITGLANTGYMVLRSKTDRRSA